MECQNVDVNELSRTPQEQSKMSSFSCTHVFAKKEKKLLIRKKALIMAKSWITCLSFEKYKMESFCSDFRYESNGILMLGVGFF